MKTNTFLNSANVNKRKIVIWGAGDYGKKTAEILKQHEYNIECFIDTNEDKVNENMICDLPVRNIDFIAGKRKEYYVVVAIKNYYISIDEYLYNNDYVSQTDFFWIERTEIDLSEIGGGVYCDDFGNNVRVFSNNKSLTIKILGNNNRLTIDKNTAFHGHVKILLCNGSDISIEECIIKDSNIAVNRSKCEIKNNTYVLNSSINVSNKSELFLNNTRLDNNAAIDICGNASMESIENVIRARINVAQYSKMRAEKCFISDSTSQINVSNYSEFYLENTSVEGNSAIRVKDKSNLKSKQNSICGKITVTTRSKMEIIQISCIDVDLYAISKSYLCLCRCILNNDRLVLRDSSEIILNDCHSIGSSYIASNKHSNLHISNSEIGKENCVICLDDSNIEINLMKSEQCSTIGSRHNSFLNGDAFTLYHNSKLSCHHDSRISIGKDSSMAENVYILVNHMSRLKIGSMSKFAKDVTILAGESHPVFDINNPQPYSADAVVEIGDNVWLGKGCMVLGGSIIGESSIVSPNSVTAKKYPNNCIIMGYPARVVKCDIAFDMNEVDPDKLDKRYWNLTQDD